MIRIVYGKAKSGKTYQIYDEIAAMASKPSARNSAVLIVPEQYTLEAEKQLIEHLKTDGFIGIEVVSFKRLAHRVLEEVGMPEGVKISEVGQIMLLRRLFAKSHKQLSVYQSAYSKMGFLSQVHDLIKELKQNMITPELLDRVVDQFKDEPLLRNKLKDFNLIFKAYETEKANHYLDEEDFYNFLLDCIPASKKLDLASIWIDGFDSFTVQELEVLSKLSRVAKEVTVTICSDGKLMPGHFEHTNALFNRILEISKENQVPVKTQLCNQSFPSADILHISENLLAYPYQRQEVDKEHVRIFAADNRMNEVEFCITEIIRLVRTKGYNWQDFALITNDLDAYSMSIKRLFEEYNLPYFLDEKIGVTNNPLVHLIKAYLRLYSEGFTPEHMVNVLKTGYFEHDVMSISRFELYAKQYGIREKKLVHPFELPMNDGGSLEDINAVRESIVKLIVPEFKKPQIEVKIAIQKLSEMLSALNVVEKIEAKVKYFTESKLLNEAQQFAQIWNKTIDLFEQCVELMGDELLTIDALIEVLESGFESLEVGVLPLNENQVLIGSVDRSKSHPIKVLFFLGVNDGIVPEAGNDKQLILDSEKALISENGLKLVSDSEMFANKEQFNLYFALSRPTERLYFSYARSDSEGRVLRPSYLISKLTKICLDLKVEDERVISNTLPYRISTAKGTVKHMAAEMRRRVDGYPVNSEWDQVYNWYLENEPSVAKLLLDGLTHTNIVEKLSKKSVENAYALPIRTSVSKLEQYVQCPFKYFVEAGIKPMPQKNYELGAPDIGILFHSAMEHFGKRIYDRKLDWNSLSRSTSDALIEEIISEITDEEIYQSKFQYQYLINKLKRVSKKAAWTLTNQLASGAFTPTAFEVAFGEGIESVAPIIVELTNGEKLLIRGVIDRVDTVQIEEQVFVRIIDYKSGKKTLTLSDVYNGLQMQLMVYLSACVDNAHYFKASEISPAGAFYFKIDDPLIESTEQVAQIIEDRVAAELKLDGISLEDVRVLKHIDSELFENNTSNVIQVRIKNDGNFTKDSKLLPLDAFEGMINHVKTTIKDIGDALLDGKIDIAPCKTENFISCQYCDYKALCQFDSHFHGNVYRKIQALSNEMIVEKLKEKHNGEMDI